jgi:hypothetical protein
MAYGARLKLRLFIEGVEVPCISAQVQAVPNAPMVASIQIPPLGEGLKLPPRCIVHLYFYDFDSSYETDFVKRTGTSNPTLNGPTALEKAYEDRRANEVEVFRGKEWENSNYKLLFAGEIMGLAWTKNPQQRSLVLQCSDFSNYWDYAYQYSNTDLFGPGYKAMFSGGSTNLFTDFLTEPGSICVRIIKSPPTRYPAMKGLMGGLIHLIEAIGGSYYYEKRYAGQNVFFSLAELRLRITQMLMAYEKDTTSSKLLGGSYDGLFGRTIGNLGEQASIRKVITALSGVIFHECYPQPCPYYRPGTHGTPTGSARERIQDMVVFGALAAEVLGLETSLVTLIDSMNDTSSTLPGVDKPVERRAVVVSHTKDAIGTLVTIQKQCGVVARKAEVEAPKARQKKMPNVVAIAGVMATSLRGAASIIGTVIAKLKSAATKQSPQGGTGDSVVAKLNEACIKLRSIQELEADVTRVDKQIPPILGQQIFRPDVWFSAPPRCNVIFPEQYSQLNYSRRFMEEPTRLLLKTNNEFFGEDELFDNFYFAPKAITLKGEANTLKSMLRNDILDHELFTGILPVFEKMGEFNIFAARSGMVDGKTPKLGLAQRSCNFLYFKHRFASRQLMITARFLPYLAVGFPGLVLDQYVDLEAIRAYNKLLQSLPEEYRSAVRDTDKLLGTHFLASFTQVTHNVDAKGNGQTAIGCTYARQPGESVEFLGVRQDSITGTRKKKDFSERETEVAAIISPRLNGTGPAWGRIIKVEDITQKYSTGDFENGQKLSIYSGTGGLDLSELDKNKSTKKAARNSSKEVIVQVPIGIARRAGDYGDLVSALVGDPDITVMFKAYKITEEVNRSHQDKKIDLPPEEYIRPGWYGNCWHPAKISEVYYDMLNTGAITEPQQIQHQGGPNSTSVMTSDAMATLADALANADYKNIGSDASVLLSLAAGSSIENSVAYLAMTYSLIKQASFDVEAFIQSYTWRPVATLIDMFGTQDLKLSTDGARVVEGVEGFHSRAFGPYANLFGLVTQDIESVVGIKRGSSQEQKADKRLYKLNAVLQYVARLRVSRGILG